MRASLLLIAGVLAAPVVIGGYVALTMLLFVPMLGLRRMFPHRSRPSGIRPDGNAGYSGTENRRNAETRSGGR